MLYALCGPKSKPILDHIFFHTSSLSVHQSKKFLAGCSSMECVTTQCRPALARRTRRCAYLSACNADVIILTTVMAFSVEDKYVVKLVVRKINITAQSSC